jgi:hypothetical protein
MEPPSQFVRWTDRLETVLADDHEVDRHCRAVGSKPQRGLMKFGDPLALPGRQ